MEYPHFDYVWPAVDRAGRVGAFVTGGEGPIPEVFLRAANDSLPRVEGRLLQLPILGDATMKRSYPKPDSFIALAQRGLFVFDWSDVHRTSLEEVGAYELVSVPSKPLGLNGIDSDLLSIIKQLDSFDVGFECDVIFDPRLQTTCIEIPR